MIKTSHLGTRPNVVTMVDMFCDAAACRQEISSGNWLDLAIFEDEVDSDMDSGLDESDHDEERVKGETIDGRRTETWAVTSHSIFV